MPAIYIRNAVIAEILILKQRHFSCLLTVQTSRHQHGVEHKCQQGPEIVPIKDNTKLEIRQSPTPHLARCPLRVLACAASFQERVQL